MAKQQTGDKGFGMGTFLFLAIFGVLFAYLASIMGTSNMLQTILNTGYDVLINTIFYINAVCVIMGAIGALLTEFGVVSLAQYLISPIMRPIYGLPGAASLGVITTFLSDNPAILALASDKRCRKYFKKFELPALTNLGTAFGMGMIVCSYMLSLGSGYGKSIVCGLLGCIAGSIMSTRLMLWMTKRYYKKTGQWEEMSQWEEADDVDDSTEAATAEKKAKANVFSRVLNCILEGGKLGWQVTMATTAGMVCICTLVMILTYGPSGYDATGSAIYTGAAREGIELLPKIGSLIVPVTKVLFGFTDGSNIIVPITSLASAGASIGLVPGLIEKGIAGANEVAVFTAIAMCWSGYLTTHVSMMEALNRRDLVSPALIAHTIGGLFAACVAHYIFILV